MMPRPLENSFDFPLDDLAALAASATPIDERATTIAALARFQQINLRDLPCSSRRALVIQRRALREHLHALQIAELEAGDA